MSQPSLQTHLPLLTPVICTKHLPLQAAHERQVTLIIGSKYDHLALAAVCLCYKSHHWVTHPHTLLISLQPRMDLPPSSVRHVTPASASNCVLQIPSTHCSPGTGIQAEMSHLPSKCADLFFFEMSSAFVYRVSVQTGKQQQTNWADLKLHVHPGRISHQHYAPQSCEILHFLAVADLLITFRPRLPNWQSYL